MQKDRTARVAGLLLALTLITVGMAKTVPAATHNVFAEFGTATW